MLSKEITRVCTKKHIKTHKYKIWLQTVKAVGNIVATVLLRVNYKAIIIQLQK
jgi:hypothetical protein